MRIDRELDPDRRAAPPRAIPDSELRRLARAVRDGEPDVEILRKKRRHVRTARVRIADDRSVILKTWDGAGLRTRLRALTGSTNCGREWEALRRLSAAGVPVPAPLGRTVSGGPWRRTEILAMEDLGRCVRVGDIVPGLVERGADEEVEALASALISATAGMVRAGVMDPDHTTTNYLLPEGGSPVRVDLELARIVPRPEDHPDLYGTTLGTLLASWTFAVQAEPARAEEFAARLMEALRPPENVVRAAYARVRQGLDRQEREAGITVAIDLPWPGAR